MTSRSRTSHYSFFVLILDLAFGVYFWGWLRFASGTGMRWRGYRLCCTLGNRGSVSSRGERSAQRLRDAPRRGLCSSRGFRPPAVVPVQAESQSWDTSEVDFEGQGSMEVLEIEIEIG
jgi:hypothetical protein